MIQLAAAVQRRKQSVLRDRCRMDAKCRRIVMPCRRRALVLAGERMLLGETMEPGTAMAMAMAMEVHSIITITTITTITITIITMGITTTIILTIMVKLAVEAPDAVAETMMVGSKRENLDQVVARTMDLKKDYMDTDMAMVTRIMVLALAPEQQQQQEEEEEEEQAFPSLVLRHHLLVHHHQ